METVQAKARSRGASIGFDLIDLVKPWVSDPQTILFHHGLGGVRDIWAEWLPELIDRYRILRIDVRGHGMSRGSEELAPTLQSLGEDALAVADAVGVKDFHFVGESMGGTVGLNLAASNSARFRTLTVCNSPYKGVSLPKVDPIRRMMAQGMDKWSAATMPLRFYPDEVPPELWRWFEKVQAEMSGEFFLACVEMLGHVDLTSKLAQVSVPVLVLGSDSTEAAPVAMLGELNNLLADARMQIFPHGKHGLAISRGGPCARALRTFLDARPQ